MLDQLLDALGYAGSALNKPGRAVRGLLAGKGREGLAALPFSDSLGLTDEADQTSGKDLLKLMGAEPGEGIGGDLAGMAAEVATDPLTFLGAGVGRFAGKAADAAQLARGPRYATTAADLKRMSLDAPEFITPRIPGMAGPGAGTPGPDVGSQISKILSSPDSDRILSEIPPGSRIIGSGAEATAFGTPSGDVLRIGQTADTHGRPISDNVLQATRAVDVGGAAPEADRFARALGGDKAAPFRVERTPLATGVGDEAAMGGQLGGLAEQLRGEGLAFGDRHVGNAGFHGGRAKVIDPGAVDALPGYAGDFQPVTKAGDPGLLMRALLAGVGGDDALRTSLAAGGNDPGLARKLMGYGAATGAAAGMGGRASRSSR